MRSFRCRRQRPLPQLRLSRYCISMKRKKKRSKIPPELFATRMANLIRYLITSKNKESLAKGGFSPVGEGVCGKSRVIAKAIPMPKQCEWSFRQSRHLVWVKMQ